MNPLKLQFYNAKDGWRWRIIAANGRILADSGEAYVERKDCVHGLEVIRTAFVTDEYHVVTDDEEP